jgi:hypothetical protein
LLHTLLLQLQHAPERFKCQPDSGCDVMLPIPLAMKTAFLFLLFAVTINFAHALSDAKATSDDGITATEQVFAKQFMK